MPPLEHYLGLFALLGLPALSILTAIPRFGRFYLVSTLITAATYLLTARNEMAQADGPSGFALALYFGAVGLVFVSAHALKWLVFGVKSVVKHLRLAREATGSRREAELALAAQRERTSIARSVHQSGHSIAHATRMRPNPSIEGTSPSGLRPLAAAPHVKR